jgi:hypothetical protein
LDSDGVIHPLAAIVLGLLLLGLGAALGRVEEAMDIVCFGLKVVLNCHVCHVGTGDPFQKLIWLWLSYFWWSIVW